MAATNFDQLVSGWRASSARLDGIRKLFVVGCAKSGTTWLQNLLHGHAEIVVLGEGRVFWQLAPALSAAFKGFNDSVPFPPDHAAVLRNEDLALSLRFLIDRQLQRYLDASPDKRDVKIVGDKTPMHTLAIPQLSQLYSTSRFVHIIRDPRDATISQWLFWAKDNDPRDFDEFVHYSITHVWPLNVKTARDAGATLGPRYTEVRYEDLHAEPKREMRRLFEFLGVDASDAAVAGSIEAGAFERRSGGRPRGEAQSGHLYRTGVVGDWRNHVPAALADRCCAEIAPLMRSCGYDPQGMTRPSAVPA